MLSEFYPLMFWILGAALARSLIFPCYTLDVHYYTIPDLIEKISERLACVKWGKVPMHMGNIPTMESPKYKKTIMTRGEKGYQKGKYTGKYGTVRGNRRYVCDPYGLERSVLA
jgi:hypothetical protein